MIHAVTVFLPVGNPACSTSKRYAQPTPMGLANIANIFLPLFYTRTNTQHPIYSFKWFLNYSTLALSCLTPFSSSPFFQNFLEQNQNVAIFYQDCILIHHKQGDALNHVSAISESSFFFFWSIIAAYLWYCSVLYLNKVHIKCLQTV